MPDTPGWLTDMHVSVPLKSAKLVDYKCSCDIGVLRYDPQAPRIDTHNQIPHKCTHCGLVAYFAHAYPFIEADGKRFVHWDTMRGFNLNSEREE